MAQEPADESDAEYVRRVQAAESDVESFGATVSNVRAIKACTETWIVASAEAVTTLLV